MTTEYNECKVCGSKETISGRVKDEEVEKGKVRPELNTFLQQTQVAIMDVGKTTLTVPLITAWIDACAECGTLRVVRYDVKEIATPQVQQQRRK